MKQIYLIICSVFLTASTYGQSIQQKTDGTGSTVTPVKKNGSRLQVPFYTEDFGGGIPGSWTQNPTPAGALWTHDMDGSNGAYATGTGPINSPTKANGFIIFDSDFLDNGGSPTGTGTAPAPHVGIITTDAIDCSGRSTVELVFYQYFRQYSSRTIVGVSNDGANFVYDTLNTAVEVNKATANSEKVTLNISSVAANQSAVYLRFIFDGTPPASSGPGYYFWQIDDISLSELPANELRLEKAYVFNSKYGNYYRIPQIHVDTMSFMGAIYNYGSADQSNVNLNVNIKRAGATVYNEDSTLATFVSQVRDSLSMENTFLPAAIGTYTGTMTLTPISGDVDPTNNVDTFRFATTDTIYSLDQGIISSYMGTNSFAGASDQPGFKLANYYEMVAADTVTSVTFYVSRRTSKGAQINIQILNSSQDDVLHSQSYTIPDTINKTIGSLLTVTISGRGVPLEADSAYFVAIEMDGSTGDTIQIADDESLEHSPSSSMMYLPVALGTNAAGWYTNGNAFIIRLNLGVVKPLGINDKVLDGSVSIFPNPAQNNLTINWTNTIKPEKVEITNVLGEVVYFNFAALPNKNSLNVNTTQLSNGIYFVKMSANNQIITKKIVVNK